MFLTKTRLRNMKKFVVLAILAVLALGSFSFIPGLTKADITIGTASVNARGLITDWGTTRVFGFIGIRAGVINQNGTIRQLAMVQAMWSPDLKFNQTESDIVNATQLPPGNITFSFYAAKLISTTQVAFNSSGFDLVVTGFWNVFNVTESLEIGTDGQPITAMATLTPLVTNATGELDVTAPHFPTPGTFTLTITGIDPLTGILFRYFQRSFEIQLGDLDATGATSIRDLVKVAQSYGSLPGMPGYSEYFDFNFNLKIDIGDLSTVAQSIQP